MAQLIDTIKLRNKREVYELIWLPADGGRLVSRTVGAR